MSLSARFFAAIYDRATAASEQAGLSAHRAALLREARGRVLEIGGGTGANLQFYSEDLHDLVITEPEDPMARRLARKVTGTSLPAHIVRAAAEHLPFADASFDYAVSTLVLCTVADPARAIAEIHRILKQRGRLLFIEHVRADDPRLARWQDRLERPWRWFGQGCRCNRETVEYLERGGFSIVAIERRELPKAPPIVRPLVVGIAERDGR
jgi:ubiquinone/menaquinone biosynthesis C-methylase UbiE